MTSPPRICVVIPVYNHAATLRRVVREAQAFLPVVVVNDGSTDATPAVLAEERDITLLTLPSNQGKAAALGAGFDRARELGFTHAITIDADGQHPTGALAEFIAACQRQPDALVVGVRDLKQDGAPWPRRLSNHLSSFWFKFETSVPLRDTQCGYRCYPLQAVGRLRTSARRYAWELEVMVRAAWAGVPLVPLPIASDYRAATSRLSHFEPGRDMLEISWVHSRLCFQAFCLPALLRGVLARGDLRGLPWRARLRVVGRHLFSEHTQRPEQLALAVGLGLFCGIVPIWGYQMVAAAVLAHQLRLNKAIALAASNISFPLLAPFVVAAGLVLGHYLLTGQFLDFAPATAPGRIVVYLGEYLLGSVVLAVIVGVLGAAVAYGIAQRAHRRRAQRQNGGGS